MKIMKWFGVEVSCHYSLFVFLVLILLIWPEGFIPFVLTYLSIVPHEFGHILAARYYGIECKGVIMTPIGGMALLKEMPKEWHKEFWITLCGPLVSLFLAITFLPIALLSYKWTMIPTAMVVVNVMLFLFNLLPIYPMDGGRIFRSSLHAVMPLKEATLIATRVSLGLGGILAILGAINGQWLMAATMLFLFFIVRAENAGNQVRQTDREGIRT